MDVWEQINASLSIIAWPLVVGLSVLVVFREQVRSLLARITKGKLGGAEIELAEKAVTAEGNQEIREVTESGSATTAGGPRPAEASRAGQAGAVGRRAETHIEMPGTARGVPSKPSGGPSGADDTRTHASRSRFTRQQVEWFIRIAAATGHRVGAVSGYKDEVFPLVRWTEDGVPEIVRWRRLHDEPMYDELLARLRADQTPKDGPKRQE